MVLLPPNKLFKDLREASKPLGTLTLPLRTSLIFFSSSSKGEDAILLDSPGSLPLTVGFVVSPDATVTAFAFDAAKLIYSVGPFPLFAACHALNAACWSGSPSSCSW